ncbi:hypothetical protein CQ010_16045 [Arthrobacter sp. MYb211]|nr:hypothetical protein CQ015_16030 [Arthrobacter sp. MYb221]PRC05023.1 hypothetical protein CQ010_16045 [Arthrobacter sp. MYb211]
MMSTNETASRTPKGKRLPWFWLLPIPIVIVVALLIWSQIPGKAPESAQAPSAIAESIQEAPATPAAPPAFPDVSRLDPKDPTAVGSVDAPVVMVAYSDFQCPFCAKWTDSTLPKLTEKYVDNGQLRIEWRDLDIFGEASLTAAQAGQAAALQGGYIDFHHRMSQGGNISAAKDFTDESLIAIAEDLGMEGDKLVTDMGSSQVKDAVQRNIAEAQSLGVLSTPSFLINRTPFVGAQPLANFEAAIEAELAKAEAEQP